MSSNVASCPCVAVLLCLHGKLANRSPSGCSLCA
jgi:hypothetical protein